MSYWFDIPGYAQNVPAVALEIEICKSGCSGATQLKAPMSTFVDRQPVPCKKCVLIVDDDVELAAIYRRLLETFNYEVSTASNGAEALKQLLRRDRDAIICDLRMSGLEGDLFYSALAQVKPHLCSRFIFLTGVADDPQYHSFLSQVKSPVLHKPVHPEQLLMELQRLPAANGSVSH